ncbi:MAG: serine hydrolase domain-containing protein [Dysgonomonas sp.]
MITRFSLITLLLFSINGFSQNSLPDSVSTQLTIGIGGFKDRYHVPAIAVAVVKDQEVVYSKAIGVANLETMDSITPYSKFPIQSVTKLFTATMLMMLEEEGIVNLNDEVRKYVPEFICSSDTTNTKTTLFQLATHTSGLPRNSGADINFAKKADMWLAMKSADTTLEMSSKQEFIRSLHDMQYEYEPYDHLYYEDRHYSNLGYSLLGISLERAAQSDYITYIMKNLCAPLGMEKSGFIDNYSDYSDLVKGYHYDSRKNEFRNSPLFLPNSAVYAGGMYSTVMDMAKFLKYYFREDVDDSCTAISDINKNMMYKLNIGWKSSYPLVIHEGSMIGHRSMIAMDPKLKVGWIILVNGTEFDFSRINNWFKETLFKYYNSKEQFLGLDRFIGTYKLQGGYDSLKIHKKDGNLYSTYLNEIADEKPMIRQGNNHFKVEVSESHSIGYEFLFDNASDKVFLNLGQLMWVKE